MILRMTTGCGTSSTGRIGRREPASDWKLAAEERIIWLTARDAISWLNEAPEEYGSFWEFAKKVAE
jgi:hypothetical protein